MAEHPLLETLRATDLPIYFEEHHLRMIAEASERITRAAGDAVFHQGEPSDAVYVVIDGHLEAAVQHNNGADPDTDEETVVGVLGPGTLFGEMQILTGGRRTASVYAREVTDLLKIQRTAIADLMGDTPALIEPMANLIRDRLRHNRLVAMLPALFGPVDETTLDDIKAYLSWVHLERGEPLVRQGDQSNEVYLLISGRLLAVREDESGQESVVGEVQPGEIIGEMAFFSDEPRAVSLYARRDVDLVRFSREAFTYITASYPQVMQAIMKLLIKRLRSRNRDRAHRKAVTNFAVVAISPGVNLGSFAERLGHQLASHGETVVLGSEHVDALLETPGAAQAVGAEPNTYRLRALLDTLEERHTHIVYTADPEDTAWSQRCIRQADLVLLVAESDADPAPSAVEQHLMIEAHGHASMRSVLVLVHPDGQQRPIGTARWLAGRNLERHLHLRWNVEADFGRLARVITGNAVGLVLGGGGARGAAHIGVIQALVEKGVPIDFVGGTSAGGGIAAQFALGYSIEQMRDTNWKAFVDNNPARPYTLPIMSLAARHRSDELAQMLYGDVQIEDLWTTFYCLSCDLSVGKQRVHQQGPLWKAIRATTALPGIFAPLIEGDHLLVDGGLLDNLPFASMQDLGAGVLILVDVSSGEALTVNYPYEEMPTPWQVARSWLNPFTSTLEVPSLPAILMRTTAVSSLGKLREAQHVADLILRPPVDGYGMLEFKAMDDLIACGYQYTKERLATWKHSNGLG